MTEKSGNAESKLKVEVKTKSRLFWFLPPTFDLSPLAELLMAGDIMAISKVG